MPTPYETLTAARELRRADQRLLDLWTLGILAHRTRRPMVIPSPLSRAATYPVEVALMPAPSEPLGARVLNA